jgi:hypothetical protein
MVVVERLEYPLTREILEEAAATAVREFVPKAQPRHTRQTILQITAGIGSCVSLLVVGVVLKMGIEHYLFVGLCLTACLVAAVLPWVGRSINNGLSRFTRYAQGRVRDRMLEASASALGKPVRWEFDEEGFRTVMLDRARRVEWTDLKRLRVHPKFWFLRTPTDELLLPAFALTDPARDLIRRKAGEACAKVVEA